MTSKIKKLKKNFQKRAFLSVETLNPLNTILGSSAREPLSESSL